MVLSLAACTVPAPEDSDGADAPALRTDDGGGLPTRSPLPTRPTASGTATASPDPAPDADPLSDFEAQLAGTWRRYHEKNSGEWNEYWYYEYVDFNEDRTACRWRYGYESSTDSDEGVFDEGDYGHWEIAQELSGNRFRVVVDGRGIDYVFDFTRDRVHPFGFETLVFQPNTDGKSCVARGGPSY